MNKLLFALPIVLATGCGEVSPEAPSTSGELTILDTIGVEFGDPNYTFGAIMGMEFLPDGGFAVLDRAMGNIRVYSPSGEFLRDISAPGSGPGEVVQAYGMLLFPDGDFGIMDPSQGGLMRFSPQGEYLGLDFEIRQNIPLGMVMVGDSGYAGSRTAILDHEGAPQLETFIGHFPMRWEPDHKYISTTAPLDVESISGFLMETMLQCPWAVDPSDGTVYAAPYSSGEFRIGVYPLPGSPDGTPAPGPASVIELDLPAVEKTQAEIEEEREYYAALFTVMEMGDPQYNVYCDPFPFRHPVRSMTVDDARRLWVLRGDTDEVSFFLFSPSGELLREFTLPGLPPAEQLVFRVRGQRMLVYAENPADYQRIWLVEIPRE